MKSANPSTTLGSFSYDPPVTTNTKFTARINKLLQMRQTIDSLLFKTMNDLTNQSYDSEIFCPEERIKEIELRTQRKNNFVEELFKDSCLGESIEQFLNDFANQPNETNMNNLESDDEAVDTTLVSSFPHSDNDSGDEEVLNELIEYENAGTLRLKRKLIVLTGMT
ncbi:hypothetical protein Tco_1187836 [Tanacetum coccineum]